MLLKLEKEYKINGHKVTEMFSNKGLTVYEYDFETRSDGNNSYTQYVVNENNEVVFSFHSDSPISIKGLI